MVTQQQIQKFADYCEQHLDFSVGDSPGYLSAPICALDAVFSPRMKYQVVIRILERFCQEYNLKLLETSITTSRMMALLKNSTPQQLADKLNAHNRTCGQNSILKFDAFVQILTVLKKHKIETCSDIHNVAGDPGFEKDFLSIQGQGCAALNYFYILSRMENCVKVDVHIRKFVNQALPGCMLSNSDIVLLIRDASKVLAVGTHKGMTPRYLDYLIWKF